MRLSWTLLHAPLPLLLPAFEHCMLMHKNSLEVMAPLVGKPSLVGTFLTNMHTPPVHGTTGGMISASSLFFFFFFVVVGKLHAEVLLLLHF